MPEPVYLDCAASAPLLPELAERLLYRLTQLQGNAQSQHYWGEKTRLVFQQAQQTLAELSGFPANGVIFTSGATESNQLAILGLQEYAAYLMSQGKKVHAISSHIEHDAVYQPLQRLEQCGWKVDYLPCDKAGRVLVADLQKKLCDSTLLVSLMAVNNETGVVQDLDTAAHILEEHPAWFHCDAAQGFGRVALPKRLDMLSISGHKIYAPVGVGALLMRNRQAHKRSTFRVWQEGQSSDWPPLSPLFYGGGQQYKLRSGSPAAALADSLAYAAQLLYENLDTWNRLNNKFRQQLVKILQPFNPLFHGAQENVLPHIINFSLPGLNADTLLLHTEELISVSRASACSSTRPSRVLKAMGCQPQQLRGALRFSWMHSSPSPNWREIEKRWQRLTAHKLLDKEPAKN